MKKIFIFITLVIGIFCMTGCFTSDVKSFEISNYPKATYLKGEKFDWSSVTIKINDQVYSYKDAEDKGVIFPQIDLYEEPTTENPEGKQVKEGTYSATIKYETLTASFQYTVLDTYFANGNGTEYNPYQVSTETQLKHALVVNTTKQYYIMINDIELSDSFKTIKEVKNVIFDGNGYKISNLAKTFITSSYSNIFKNINFEVNVDSPSSIITNELFNENTFENVNVYGNIKGWSNCEALFGFVYGKNNVLINCNNFASIDAHKAAYIGIFTSCISELASLFVVNCKNYGDVFAQSIGLFYGHGTSNIYSAGKLIIDSNTHNYGKLISTLYESNIFMANQGNQRNWLIDENNTFKSVVRIMKFDNKKGYNSDKYSMDVDKFDFEDANSFDYKNLAVTLPSTVESVGKLTIEEDHLNVEIKEQFKNSIVRYEIQFMANYTYCTNENILEKGGANEELYSKSIEATDELDAYTNFINLLKSLKYYDVYNISADCSSELNMLPEGYTYTGKNLTDENGHNLKIYSKTENENVKYCYVYDVKASENNSNEFLYLNLPSIRVQVTCYDADGNCASLTIRK